MFNIWQYDRYNTITLQQKYYAHKNIALTKNDGFVNFNMCMFKIVIIVCYNDFNP